METAFARRLTLLRKERNKSQKEVAKDMGVSQALLSHYENGIRKPGLEFVLNCANYYHVSCDYLLGRSPEQEGSVITVDTIPEPEAAGKNNQGITGMYAQLHKKLISNSLNILFDLLTKNGNKQLTSEISNYLSLAVYQMFRTLYGANAKNEQSFFSIPNVLYSQYTTAIMQIIEAHAKAMAAGRLKGKYGKHKTPPAIAIHTKELAEEYPLFASSLFNLIQSAEQEILKRTNHSDE